MTRQTGVYAAGAVFLLLLTLVINLAISLKLLFPASVIEWIGASNNPRLTLWIVSLLAASFVIAILKLGVKLSFIKPWVERPDHPLFTYILGLPLVIVLSVLAFSGFSLAFLSPTCESPFASIEVTSLADGVVEYTGKSITAKAGSQLALVAKTSESTVVFCTWSSSGTAIQALGPKSSCATQVSLSNEPGRGIITLSMSKSYCSVKSINPLEVITVP